MLRLKAVLSKLRVWTASLEGISEDDWGKQIEHARHVRCCYWVGLRWSSLGVHSGGSDEFVAPFVTALEALRASRYIIVQPGQSVTRIAQAYHVPAQAIIAANHLTPPYKLKVGGRLEVPLPGVERWREIVQEELRVFQTPATV